jgi:hypothetical protein
VQGRGLPTLGEGAEGGTERAERSGGLHKRSAEDWGSPCAARGQKGGGQPKGRRQGGAPPLHFILIEEVILNTLDVVGAFGSHAEAILKHELAESISIHQDDIFF